ncbi:Hypothetical protein A7982_09872 [Minicystis rosea]|nr:Hypothetical protein A7982_09872 [Minicystis rosea]
MGQNIWIALTIEAAPNGGSVDVRGVGPGALRFGRDDIPITGRFTRVSLVSSRATPLAIGKVSLQIDWTANGGDALYPGRSENIAYVTMGRPREDQQNIWQEDGVTLKRMDRAVSWVAPMRTLHPHSIVRGLMRKFPYYSLKPSPKVPRQFHHPTFFNRLGGAWPMSDYVEEAGECQAIVRLVRGVLRQLGVPGEARALLVWAEPGVANGQQAVSAYWDDDPSAGLSTTMIVDGRRWLAALSDGPVEVGAEYPASHTIVNGKPSPGMNRYEACLEFTHNGETRYYGGGAGVYRTKEEVLRAFWGLVWVSWAPNDGFRVEDIVTRY